jgi:hypothetical protein
MSTQALTNSHLSQHDQDFLALAFEARKSRKLPEVGDFIRFQDGSLRRISASYEDAHQHSRCGSFYLGAKGYSSFSGGLDRSVKQEAMELTEETQEGTFWIWKDGVSGAGRGVNVSLPCRVWSYMRRDVMPDTWDRQHEYCVLVLKHNEPSTEMGYRVLVTKLHAAHTAFRTEEEFNSWMSANGLQRYADIQDSRGDAYWAGKA